MLLSLVFIGLVFGVVLRKRIFSLALIAIPAAALLVPYLVYQVIGSKTWLGVFADPTISRDTSSPSILQSLLGEDSILGWCAIGLFALALIALISRAKGILVSWLVLIVAIANLWFVQSIRFSAGGVGSIFQTPAKEIVDSSTPAVMLMAISALVSVVLWLEAVTRSGFRKFIVTAAFLLGTVPLAISAALSSSLVSFGQERNLPAIVTAEAQAGSSLRLLTITRDEDLKYRAELIWPNGIKLDSVSTAYRLSTLNTGTDSKSQLQTTLSTLVANLVSANGKDLGTAFSEADIGFVLVPDKSGNGDLGVALNSVAELDEVGLTDFGQLWRVKTAAGSAQSKTSYWSITKGIQVSVLIGFILLALPTSRGRKRDTQGLVSDLEPEEVEQ